MTNTSDNNGI